MPFWIFPMLSMSPHTVLLGMGYKFISGYMKQQVTKTLQNTGLYVANSLISSRHTLVDASVLEAIYGSMSFLGKKVLNDISKENKKPSNSISHQKDNNETNTKNITKQSLVYIILGVILFVLHKSGSSRVKKFLANKVKRSREHNTLTEIHEKNDFIANKNLFSPIEILIDKIYTNAPFYKIDNTASYESNPLRVVFTILLGLVVIIEDRFNFGENSDKSDFASLDLVLYVELLAHTLKMHKSSPLYVSTKVLLQLICPEYAKKIYINPKTKSKSILNSITKKNPWAHT